MGAQGRGATGRAVLAAVVGVVAALAGPGVVRAQEYHVDREAERSAVFVSRAAIEEFEGRTERIDGYVLLDGGGVREADGFEGAELYFEVDLASLDTGIGLRNRHMRDNYLEVEEHPYATFSGDVARIAADDGAYVVTSRGTFAVHGVEQPRTLECRIRPGADEDDDPERWRVGCAFTVNLRDHEIEIPRVMFLKLAEEIRVELAFGLRRIPSTPETP